MTTTLSTGTYYPPGITLGQLADRDELVDWLSKPFQAPGAHVSDYSKPVKAARKTGLCAAHLDLHIKHEVVVHKVIVDCLHVGVA